MEKKKKETQKPRGESRRSLKNRSRLKFNNQTWSRHKGEREGMEVVAEANKRRNARNREKREKKIKKKGEKLERRFQLEDDSKTLSPTGGGRGWERGETERKAGSHTLITRMLYACWWDTYVWALVSKVVCTAYARRPRFRIYPREGRFRHRDFNVSVAARSV